MVARVGWTLKRWQESVTVAAAAGVLVVLVAPPLIATFVEVLGESAAIGALAQPRLLYLLSRSIQIALWTTLIGLAVGVPLGALLGRTRSRFAGVALFLHALPLTMTPFITALAAFHVLGRQGWLGSPTSADWLFSESGCVSVFAVCFTPVISILTFVAVRGTDPDGDDAARTVAGPWRTLMSIILPLAAPSIALGAIVVFALALSEVSTPMFLRVDVYSAAVFVRLGGFAFAPGEAAALSLPLLGVSLLLWAFERSLPAHRVIALPRTRTRPPILIDTASGKRLAQTAGALAAAAGACPVLVMCRVAANGDGFALLSNYAGDAIANSVLYAASVSSLTVALALVLTSAAREHPRLVMGMDAIAWLGFLIPPALFAVAAITVWNRAATHWIYGSAGIVILALAARYVVLALRIHLAGARELSPSLSEAARVYGAGHWRRLLSIEAPALRRYSWAAWLLAFVFCIRDVETSALLYPPGGEPLSVRLFTLEANGPPAVVSAMAAVLGLLVIIPLAGASLLLRRRV